MGITLNKLYPGKLDHDFLHHLLSTYTSTGSRVIAGAQVGEDAAVIDMGDKCLVVKTDPITFTTEHIGYYAVHVNANDIVCMGATPKWFTATLLLPEKSTRQMAENIFAQISRACKTEKIVYCGGHTEVTYSIKQPIVVGQMLGEVGKDELLLKRHIAIGDHLVLIQHIPIEAVSILAREKQQVLQEQFSADFVRTCQNFLFFPGIGIAPYAQLARDVAQVHAMHDPTEGGVATAIHEMARAADRGVVIDQSKIPIMAEGKLVCEFFDLDPLGCLSSGSLLLAVPHKSIEPIIKACSSKNIPAADIGKFVEKEKGLILLDGQQQKRLPLFVQDEIVKIF
ncbi:hydrogenase expression/formation protein [candidate division KSB1 bacterium]|nr:AIR synthase family protein [candidate division KSB1 bacterium]RQW04718.1 MAG: hydrogenase expression/formation protein [candidate division KSB1 bacterium]